MSLPGVCLVFTFFMWRFPSTACLGEQVYTKGYAMTWNDDWASQAQCRETRPDELFVRGAAQNRAKQMCAGCPVRTECLAEALDNEIEWGVWGGLTERERRAVLRKRPNVTSWRAVLETARSGELETKTVVSA